MQDLTPSLWKLPALSGVLFFLAYYSGLLVPNLILFVPLLLWLDLDPGASRLRRMWAGFIFGLVTFLPAMHFHYYMAEFTWLAWVLYAGMVVALPLKLAITIAVLGWLRSTTRWSFGLLLPLVWLPVEWLQTWGDLRLTVDHIGPSLGAYPFLVQFADLVGPYGLGAFLLGVNGLIYESLYGLYKTDRRRARVWLVVLLGAVLSYDGWAWTRALRLEERAEKVRVALVQPNIPFLIKRGEDTDREQSEVLESLTREAAAQGAELIVWPETARPDPFYHLLEYPQTYAMADVQELARDLGVSLLVGAEYYRVRAEDDWEVYNAAFLAHPDGELDPSWGAKVYLVPFVEGVPFESVLGPLVEGRRGEWSWVAGGFTPGPGSPLLPLGDSKVGVLVCYEQFFPDLARNLKNSGAGLQAVITNDIWYGRSLFQEYQINVLRLRAIENRTWYVRSANTGYSGFVDPLGRVHSRTRLFEEAVEIGDLSVSTRPTVYNRIGDLVAYLAIAGLGVAAVFTVRARRRPRWPGTEPTTGAGRATRSGKPVR